MINSSKRVAMLIAPSDFRDEEYFQPKVMLDAVGIIVSTVAKGNPEEVSGLKGGKAHIDAKIEDINPKLYDGLVLVGGKGAEIYFEDKEIHQLIKTMLEAGKIVGAICIAPVILAKAGVLNHKQATVYEDGIKTLIENMVEYTSKPIVTDGNIITALDHTVAMSFGAEVAQKVLKLELK